MGNTYVIEVWDGPINGPYSWLEIYRGESLWRSIYWMFWCRRQGWKCIKMEYRP